MNSGLVISLVLGIRAGFLAGSMGTWVRCSIPPAKVTSEFPVIISMAPSAAAFMEEAHCLSIPMAGTVTGRPASRTGCLPP